MAWLAITTEAGTEASWRLTSSISAASSWARARSSGDSPASGSSSTSNPGSNSGSSSRSRSTGCSPPGVHKLTTSAYLLSAWGRLVPYGGQFEFRKWGRDQQYFASHPATATSASAGRAGRRVDDHLAARSVSVGPAGG